MAQSRAEAIIEATLNGETWEGIPQSRMEKLLMQLNHGGTGTTDYNALTNLPTINDEPIKGEISDDILELVEPLSNQEENDLLDIITDD